MIKKLQQEERRLEIEMYGAYPIIFESGWSTGPRKGPAQNGVSIRGLCERNGYGGVLANKDIQTIIIFLERHLKTYGT